MKRILSIILVLVTLVLCCIPSFAYDSYVGLAKPLDLTTVEEDMENAGFDFDRWEDNGNIDQNVEILFTREYGYTQDGAALLYVYVYIDPSIYEVFPSSVHDIIEIDIASKFDENGSPISYLKKWGECIDHSEDKRFYKYCIRDLGGFEWENGRLYYIGDIGVYQNGDELTEYETRMNAEVNRGYYYTGLDSLDTVECEVFQDNILDLDTTATVYRTLSSDKGLGYQYDIFSVYFSVPNEYFEKYDYLRAISYKYYEQLWNAVICDTDENFSALNSMLQIEFGDSTDQYKINYPSVYVDIGTGLVGSSSYSLAINPRIYSFSGTPSFVESLKNVYKVEDYNDDDLFISGDNVTNFFNYTETGDNSNWVYASKTYDETFDINSFSGNDPDFITKYYAWWYQYSKGYETQLSGVVPIVTYKDATAFDGYIEGVNDETYANEHLVNKRDIADFVNVVETSTANNESVVLFRFAVRDYYSRPCDTSLNGAIEIHDSFYCQGTAFNKFNIITLTFRKSNQDFIVYVNDDPQDINGGITGPVDTIIDDTKEAAGAIISTIINNFKSDTNDLIRTITIILGCIAVLIAVLFLSKPIGKIFEKRRNKKE